MRKGKFDDYIIAKVLHAYLIEGKSHRFIQREILELPAPAKGGGFVAMQILHEFNIKGKDKGILKNNFERLNEIESYAVHLIKSYLEIQEEAVKNIEYKINPKNKKTEQYSVLKTRVYQDVLKRYVLLNYCNKCALCDIDQPELLVASHIIPWSVNEDKRLNLDNCILLCNLHDKLFDKGFICLDGDLTVRVSKQLSKNVLKYITELSFRKPTTILPNIDNLKVRMEQIFKK
jgi:putative restriction endonuclease